MSVQERCSLSQCPLINPARSRNFNQFVIKLTHSGIMGENPPEEEAPFPLTDVDKWILSQTDEEFHYHDWEDLKDIIGEFESVSVAFSMNHGTWFSPRLCIYTYIHGYSYTAPTHTTSWRLGKNDLSVLKRKPSDLRRYMKWTAETKAEYGSMTNFLLVNRLPKAWGAPPFTPTSSTPFEDPSDYKVLINDWPYGLDAEIRHIVVWLRTTIPTDADTGDMTPESRALCEDFVKRYFVDHLGPGGEGRVLWFKNWVALQSVRALEHIHILVRNVDEETIERWTGERPRP